MPQIQAPQLAGAIRGRYGIRGAQGFDTISPEIVPVSIVDTVPVGGGARSAMGCRTQGAVAAQLAVVGLATNSADMAVRVVRWFFSVDAAATVWLYLPRAGQTLNAGDKEFLNRTINGRPSCTLGGNNVAVNPVGSLIEEVRTAGAGHYTGALDIRLSADGAIPYVGADRILIIRQNVNTILVGGFEWEEADQVPAGVS